MQVYVEDRYVGDFNREIHESMQHFVVQIMDAGDLWVEPGIALPTVKTRSTVVNIKQRGVCLPVDDYRLKANPNAVREQVLYARKRFNIPEDAKMHEVEDAMTGRTQLRFTWRAIQIPQDQYEEYLFENPSFEPV